MKALVTVTALLISSSAFAVLRDNYSCQDSTGKIQVSITASNRPDFEIEKYDSAAGDDENDGIASFVEIDGKETENARIQMMSYKGGAIEAITDKDDEGRTCTYGSKETSVQMKINLTVAGESKAVDLSCSVETELPRGAVDCE